MTLEQAKAILKAASENPSSIDTKKTMEALRIVANNLGR